MATLAVLKQALRDAASTLTSSLSSSSSPTASTPPLVPLSDCQYSAGFDLIRSAECATYNDFIVPQLSSILTALLQSRETLSILEIGPGPESVLGLLPAFQRRKVTRYTAFEPNAFFALRLQQWLRQTCQTLGGVPLPCLQGQADIHQVPFNSGKDAQGNDAATKFDLVLFCHSMYGMKPKHDFLVRALQMLDNQSGGANVVVFHRAGVTDFGDLICRHEASFTDGTIRIANEDNVLDCFASFIAGGIVQSSEPNKAIHHTWRQVCRALGRYDPEHPDQLVFRSPNSIAVFDRYSVILLELIAQVPLDETQRTIKNREARLHRPAAVVRPTEVQQIQCCVRWALKHGVGLTVLGGGHSSHCLWPNVVCIDLNAFQKVIVKASDTEPNKIPGMLIIAETGCTTGNIVRKATNAGLAVPLGARPSVGAGLWLQGGIGHLARMYGLTSDAIVGAVIVSLDSGQLFCVGQVPTECKPTGAVRPANEHDLLWAIKGAGTNVGIVLSVTFTASKARSFAVRNWVIPLSDSNDEPYKKLSGFEMVAKSLSKASSADAYIFFDLKQLRLGVSLIESTTNTSLNEPEPLPGIIQKTLGRENSSQIVDSIGLFDSEMYISGMHGGHGGGKTSSFKRCVFLKGIGARKVAEILVSAVERHATPLCYIHLLHGGGAISQVAPNETSFGCRDWDFACVVTGVWPREQDGTQVAEDAVRWVYTVVQKLLPVCSGVYGSDLGPDPRDADLATLAFGSNLPRLARLKHMLDPRRVLAHACPLPTNPLLPKLIVAVTGECGSGKDYSAGIWTRVLSMQGLKARTVSISDATKYEYAVATGANPHRLLADRAYKEQHRLALTKFFHDQLRERPRLLEEHFLSLVDSAHDLDVLLITGMREKAPVATLSHLVSTTRLIEVRVVARKDVCLSRRGLLNDDDDDQNEPDKSRPTHIFENSIGGSPPVERFAKRYLLSYLHGDIQRLRNMVSSTPSYPRPGIEFRHVLGIGEQPGGLSICASLLRSHFAGDWIKVTAIVCCEAGGFLFASALATLVDKPLALIREEGKLPPPTISVAKPRSHVSSAFSKAAAAAATGDEELDAKHSSSTNEKRIEMARGSIPKDTESVVVVDDVLATGATLGAALQLLIEGVGIRPENINVLVVAEFPKHRGREMLRQRGFGGVFLQSLLVFGGD